MLAKWTLMGVALIAAVGKGAAAAESDLETIRARILAPWLEPVPVADVERLVGAMRPDGSWPDIDYGNQRRSSWPTARHLTNVGVLARAYQSPESRLHGKPELQRAVLGSLDYWLEHDFQNSNWWWNQIGVPRSLAPILLLMEDDLSPAQRDRGLKILRRAKIGMTGQNLVWVTEITARRGMLEKDPALVAAAYRRIAEEIHVGTGEGIQADYSFHQHGPCLYSHGYGAGFIVDCSRIAAQVAGTRMAFSAEKIAVLSNLILDGSQWMARGSTTDFGAEGREITRQGQTATHLAAAARYMLELPTGREDEFRALAARASGGDAPALQGNRHFWCSDLMTHHRAGYYTSARMFSRRIVNTDQPCNSEGLKSHHVADGCNLVMRTGREYHDVFPVWDWQKIPGTTVEQMPQLTGSPRRKGERSFAGGVSDGTYGLAAFDFARDALSARKSWFFFDDEYVCLGAGIACPTKNPVVTTVNQCHLVGDVLAATRTEAEKLEPGTHALEKPAWIWHDRIAYVLVQPASVRLSNDLQRGSWSQINQQYPENEIARKVFSLWIDHGAGPQDERYAYAVVPEIERTEVEAYVARSPIRVLRNEPALQAVRHEQLDVAGMAFYEGGSVEIGRGLALVADAPCLVLLRTSPGQLTISVSHPDNEQSTVRLTVSGELRGEGVRVLDAGARCQVIFDLPGGANAGSTVTRTFRRP